MLARFDAGPAERFYAIDLGGELAGRMHETRSRDALGRPTIRVVTLLDLPGGGRLIRRETRRFASHPPHALVETELWQRGADGHVEERRETAAPGTTTLAAALGAPAQGETRRADGTATALTVDAGGALHEYRIGTGFVLRRSAQLPLLPEPGDATPLRLPVGAARTDRARIDRLVMTLQGPAATLLAPGSGASTRLEIAAPPAPTPALRRDLDALLAVVRERLDYAPGASPTDLDALLERGAGDCHEFALLFEALATRLGLETEIVTGLAWSAADPEAFVPHAWNRVREGGRWIVVDPTWGRIVEDADRIAFPGAAGAQLDLQLALPASRLELLATEPEPLSRDGPG